MGKRKIRYQPDLVVFDIETSHIERNGFDELFTWHWSIMVNDTYYTPESWTAFYDLLLSLYDPEYDRLIVFVHNLAYETESIIRNMEDHIFSDLFASDTHRPLKFLIDEVLEFRCSYMLTGKSLKACGKDVKLEKLEMDYQKIRYPGEKLTEEEESYCRRDVEIMAAKIRQMEIQEKIPFTKFPLTNTGFLRNEARKVLRKNPANKKKFHELRLDAKRFLLCRNCFSGGYVHANYIYSGKVMEDVDSYDFGSAYPFDLLVHKFPMSYFHEISNPTWTDIQYFLQHRDNTLFICHVVLYHCKCRYTNTFLSFNKCKTSTDVELDNGRVYSAEYIDVCLTSLDLILVLDIYQPEKIKVEEMYWCMADYLPDEYVKLMLKYYEQKQELKNIESEEYNYMKAKNRLNSFYGMMVTNPLHDIISLDVTDWQRDRINYHDDSIVTEELDKFYSNYNSFLPYQWGVFVPAYTRYHLWHDIIRHIDRYVVYSDTDSAKVINREQCIDTIARYNAKAEQMRKSRLEKLGYTKDFPDLGLFDWETAPDKKYKGPWKGFKTLGAKKYIFPFVLKRTPITSIIPYSPLL